MVLFRGVKQIRETSFGVKTTDDLSQQGTDGDDS